MRQSTIYQLSSLMLIMWGALTFAGYLVSYLSPRHAGYGWIAVYVAGIVGTIAISAVQPGAVRHPHASISGCSRHSCCSSRSESSRSVWLGHFTPRQMGTFWPIYFMMVYTIVGLWVGSAFVAIGLSIIALTLIGYFFVGDAFDLWMAFVNGGGLILGGLWMRRS